MKKVVKIVLMQVWKNIFKKFFQGIANGILNNKIWKKGCRGIANDTMMYNKT